MVKFPLPSLLLPFFTGMVKPLYMLVFGWNNKTTLNAHFFTGMVKPLLS